MGYGDQLIATGLARGAATLGKRIAFGDGRRILWDGRSGEIFLGNPNIAKPGSEHDHDLTWINFYKGHRQYNRHATDRWIWNMDWRCRPGEMFFSDAEKIAGQRYGQGFVLIEPNVEAWKPVAQNKDWGFKRYKQTAERLRAAGFNLAQFHYPKGGQTLNSVRQIKTKSFRDALSVLANASLYIGPEGGLHHGAAAVGITGVVIFGGFIPPQVTGYATHTNLTGGAEACGKLRKCEHCAAAMKAISVDEVVDAALGHLRKVAA